MKEKRYTIGEFIGTLEECTKFYKEHKDDCIAPPYLYEGSNYRVTYWKEIQYGY